MHNDGINIISKLAFKQKRETYIGIALIGFSVAALVVSVLSLLSLADSIVAGVGLLSGIAAILWGMYQVQAKNPQAVSVYLNHNYPALQDSADLLLKDPSHLNTLESIQYVRVSRELSTILPALKIPSILPTSMFWFLMSLTVAIPLLNIPNEPEKIKSTSVKHPPKSVDSTLNASVLKSLSITITPPPYTRLRPRTQNEFAINAPEGSNVTWSATIEGATSAALMLGTSDSIPIDPSGKPLTLSVSRSTFYHISWTTPQAKGATPYYGIDIVPDKATQIKVSGLRQFTEVIKIDNQGIPVTANLEDDYGVSDAYIIATVSKGSGESVKFREERLRFSTPQSFRSARETARYTVDLKKLGLDPGDELYFYVEAIDNRKPSPNISRTETFFIQVPDTAAMETSFDGGLGVNIVPEYFRSQRQIIIESEQLVRDRKRISKESFNARSNELAFDQKVLRLKYGEFLGEEFESQIGPAHDHAEADQHVEETIEEEFGHLHDKESEDHTPESELPSKAGKTENVTAPYTHAHDDPEESTFFIQSIRTRLKAALTYMWDAELHLRLYSPEASLPYQYKALKLLKDISNESRIYVHRTGFDPPPLKEERRLTGDLKEVQSRQFADTRDGIPPDELRNGIKLIQLRLHNRTGLKNSDRAQLERTGADLAARAYRSPGKFLDALTILRQLGDGDLSRGEETKLMTQLLQSLWHQLPLEYFEPSEKIQSIHPLDAEFIKQFEARRRP